MAVYDGAGGGHIGQAADLLGLGLLLSVVVGMNLCVVGIGLCVVGIIGAGGEVAGGAT